MQYNTYRVTQLMVQYDELSNIEKIIAKRVVKSLIESDREFEITGEEFELECDYDIAPYQVVEAMETLNIRTCFIYKYTLRVNDSDDWYIIGEMVHTVYDHLWDMME